jgi:hypothetical protein
MNPIETGQNRQIESLAPDYVRSFRRELKTLIAAGENPIVGLILNINKSASVGRIPAELSESVKKQLLALDNISGDEYIDQITQIVTPILEITKKGESENNIKRELFSAGDLEEAVEIIKESGAAKIYVVGNVGSGKTSFSEQLSDLTDYKSIDLDRSFKDFQKNNQRDANDLKELLEYVTENNEPPYIINHADLLRQNLMPDADMVVFLNPSKAELLRSREIRTKDGADGEWQNVSIEDYDKIADENLSNLNNLGGIEKYHNPNSGTSIHLLK